MSIENISLSELPESSFSILSNHLDAVNPRRRDWRTLVKKINLDLVESKEVEECNEHCRKLIEIWNQDGPKVRDLLEILEEMGCAALMKQLRNDLEQKEFHQNVVSEMSSNIQMGGMVSIQPAKKPDHSSTNSQPTLVAPAKSKSEGISEVLLSPSKPDSPISPPEPSNDNSLPHTIYPPKSIPNSQPTSVEDKPPILPEPAELKSKEVSVSEERISEARESIKKGFYVSYHQNDKAIGEEIIREMEKRKVKVFSSEDVLLGQSEIIKREELFKLSRSVIAVITPDYYKEEGFHLLEALFGASGSLFGTTPTLIPIICRTDDDTPTFITSRASIKWDNPNKFDRLFKGIQKI